MYFICNYSSVGINNSYMYHDINRELFGNYPMDPKVNECLERLPAVKHVIFRMDALWTPG